MIGPLRTVVARSVSALGGLWLQLECGHTVKVPLSQGQRKRKRCLICAMKGAPPSGFGLSLAIGLAEAEYARQLHELDKQEGA